MSEDVPRWPSPVGLYPVNCKFEVDLDLHIRQKYGLNHTRFYLFERDTFNNSLSLGLCNQLKKYPPIMPHPTHEGKEIKFSDYRITTTDGGCLLELSYIDCTPE